jgi:hypothetical protein
LIILSGNCRCGTWQKSVRPLIASHAVLGGDPV